MCAICHSLPINGSQIHLLFHCADLSPNRSIKKLLPITFNANILKKDDKSKLVLGKIL